MIICRSVPNCFNITGSNALVSDGISGIPTQSALLTFEVTAFVSDGISGMPTQPDLLTFGVTTFVSNGISGMPTQSVFVTFEVTALMSMSRVFANDGQAQATS